MRAVSAATLLSRELDRMRGIKQTKVPKPMTDAEFSRQVIANAGRECQAHLEGCTVRAVHAHHVLMRSQGGRNDPDNGLSLALCRNCHEGVHADPEQSYRDGWLRRRNPRAGDFHYAGTTQ